MKRDKTYFISDAHLGAKYISHPHEHEIKLVRWLREIEKDCRTLFLVGDIIDYWYEYKTVIPKGYVRFFGQLAAMIDEGIDIIWFIGNHDIWIFDYLQKEIGIKVVDGNLTTDIEGKKFFISHGDGIGRLSKSFQFLRKLFRNKLCQKLYSSIHPGITMPFAYGWSRKSRKNTVNIENSCVISNITEWILEYSKSHPEINYYIIGHYHILVQEILSTGAELIILGDWIDKFSYAVFDGKELKLRKYY